MKISISDRELIGLWDFMRGAIWGNTPETMLDQLEIWDVFGFDSRFSAAEGGQTKFGDLSDVALNFELSESACGLLCSYLARPGQRWPMGVHSARALKRIGLPKQA